MVYIRGDDDEKSKREREGIKSEKGRWVSILFNAAITYYSLTHTHTDTQSKKGIFLCGFFESIFSLKN